MAGKNTVFAVHLDATFAGQRMSVRSLLMHCTAVEIQPFESQPSTAVAPYACAHKEYTRVRHVVNVKEER